MKLPLKKDDQKFADWGRIVDDDGILITTAAIPIVCDLNKHRREKTDPTQERVDCIIRAVNCHDELVIALDDCVSVMTRELNGLAVIQPELRQAMTVLAKARKGEG